MSHADFETQSGFSVNRRMRFQNSQIHGIVTPSLVFLKIEVIWKHKIHSNLEEMMFTLIF
jgi:hypothetical protein